MSKEKGAEQRLLELGRVALERDGIRGLRVRRLCAEAGVSPGTFTAFFKTKRAFADRLLNDWYETLKAAIGPHREAEGGPYERLRAELTAVVRFAYHDIGVVRQLIQDVGAGEASVQALIRVAKINHVEWLQQAVRDAQAAGCIVSGSPWKLLAYVFGAANMPLIISNSLNTPQVCGARGGKLPLSEDLRTLLEEIGSLDSALQRMEWALNGITLKKGVEA